MLSLFKILNKRTSPYEMWSGNYSSWAEAKSRCTGYDDNHILEKCKIALTKVKKGEAVYERDSVVFDQIQYSWGLLSGLQKAALDNFSKLNIIDFGGSLGSTYYQNKNYLLSSPLEELTWCVIEQPHFVECGLDFFQDEHLIFYYTIEDCMKKNNPNVILLSSVLQYLEDPYEWIEKIINLAIPHIIIDRTPFVESERDIITIQNVPESIYKATYPAWFFNEQSFIKQFKGYNCIATFESFCDNGIVLNSIYPAKWKGYHFIIQK